MSPQRVLFVCLGNICRSPSAEGVFADLIKKRGLESLFEIDSAGTAGYHVGERADPRMRDHASRRGIELTSLSRKLIPADLEKFDYILGMDDSNMLNIRRLDPQGKYASKIYKMTDFCSIHSHDEVPDPYYGGEAGFELVLDILDDACTGFLDAILEKKR